MILAARSNHSLQEGLPAAFARPPAEPANTRLRILNGLLVVGLHGLLLAMLPWRMMTVPPAGRDTAFTLDTVQTRPEVPDRISIPLHMISPNPAPSVALPSIDIASAGLSTTPQGAAPAKSGGDGTTPTGGVTGGGGASAFPDATGVNDGGYLERLRQHVAKFMGDPHLAGTVVLRFSIDKRGKLLSYEILTSSGDWLVDEAALQALRRALPLPPIPDALNVPGLRITMPLKYHF